MKRSLILSAGIATLMTLPATAADRNWIGGGAPGVWNDPLNWDTGVPTSGTNDIVFMHLTGSLTGEALSANSLRIAVGTPGVASSGFTYGAGTYTVGYLAVAEAFDGLNPATNTFGRVFMNAGTTLNVGNYFVGERNGGTGQVIQNGGDVNVSGQLRVGHWPQPGAAAGTASLYELNGGSVTVAGDPADPFAEAQAGNVFLGIDSTGILRINGGTFTAKGITLDNRGATEGADTLEINGGVLNLGANGIASQNAAIPVTYKVNLNGGTVRATANWSSNLETQLNAGTGVVIDTNGHTVTFSAALKGVGGLTKTGNGVLKLTADSSYAGSTILTGGTLQIGDATASGNVGVGPLQVGSSATVIFARTDAATLTNAVSGNGILSVNTGTLRLPNLASNLQVNVAAGATFGGTGTVDAVNVAATGTLEGGVNGSGTLTTSLLVMNGGTVKVSAGTTSSKVVVTGSSGLVANGSNTIQLNAVGLTAGVYTLIDYADAIGGAGYGSFTLAGLPARAVGGLVHNTAQTRIDLNITTIDYPKWTGATNGDWDTTTSNWRLVTGGVPTTYLNLDAVLFDDTATGGTLVNLLADVTPASVLFNHGTGKTYTLAGAGGLTGVMGLTKQGTGRTIIANTGANSYSGPTTVQGGVLQIGDGVSGQLSASTTVAVNAGGTLELNLPAFTTYASPTSGLGDVRTIGDTAFDIGVNALQGNLRVTIAGSSFQNVSVASQPALAGEIYIESGTFRAVGAQALGTTASPTVITDGGTLDVNNLDLGAEEIFVRGIGANSQGAIVNSGSGTIYNLHKVTLTGDATFGGISRWDIRSTAIPGEKLDLAGHKLTKIGTNQVSLVDINMSSGDLEINGGIFSIENVSEVTGAGTIRINTGGTLGLWANKPDKLTRTIVAAGGNISELGSTGATMVNSPITLLSDLTYSINGGTTILTQVGPITESGGARALNVNGGGRLILLGNNNWTGGFSVNNAILQIGTGGTDGTLGTGPGTVTGTLAIAKSNATTISGDINPNGPAGTLILVGGGVTTLASGTDLQFNQINVGLNNENNTIGGTINVGELTSITVADTLSLGNSAGGGSLTQGVLNQTGGVVNVNVPGTDGRQFVLGHWGMTQGIYNLSGGLLSAPNISMSVSWDGEGTFNLTGGTANVKGLRFGHNAGRSGIFNLTGGELNLGSDGIWAQNANFPNDINLGGGTVRAAVNTSITLPAELTGMNGPVVFDTNGFAMTISGLLSGTGGLTKTGAGTLIVNQANSYTGTTEVMDGTLQVDTPFGSGTGLGNVNVGANGRLSGSGTLGIGTGNAVTIQGKLAPGDGAGVLTFNLGGGALDIIGAVSGGATGHLEFELGTNSDRVVFMSGALSIGMGELNFNDFIFTAGSGLASGDYLLFDGVNPINGTLGTLLTGPIGPDFFGTLALADGGNDLVLHVVPEPGSALLLMGGLALMAQRRRRTRA